MRKPTEKTTINTETRLPQKMDITGEQFLTDRKGKHFCVWRRRLNDRNTRQECRRLLSSLSGLKIVGVEIVKGKEAFLSQ